MRHPFADFYSHAASPFKEPLVWVQDKAPHLTGTFDGVVLQGAAETQSAGVPTDYIIADSYTIHVGLGDMLVEKFEIGDTIQRECWKNAVLSVQRVFKDETGFWVLCTAEERSPLG